MSGMYVPDCSEFGFRNERSFTPVQAKWAKLEGDGELTWFDAELTDTGKQQALAAHELWKKQVQERNMSLPQTFYTSPLRRALKTTEITFSGLSDWSGKPPMVKEVGVSHRVYSFSL